MEPLDHKEFYVSWEDMHRTTRQLAAMLIKTGKTFRGIVAVSRGGLVPAAILARELNIRLVDTICISSYDNDKQRGLQIIKDVLDDADDILIVDALFDTGTTAKVINDKFPNANFVTVYANKASHWLICMLPTSIKRLGSTCLGIWS